MSARNSATSWGWVARLLHWVMALMILVLIGVGIYMSDFETDLIRQFQLIQMHKSFGFTVFVLAVVRVIWRFTNPTPALPDGMPQWQVSASHVSHALLYLLILAMPITGWLMVTSSPLNDPGAYPVQIPNLVFGLFAMPDPYPTGSKELSDTFATIHWALAYLLILVLLLHVAAALKHQLVDRDGLLMRMIRG